MGAPRYDISNEEFLREYGQALAGKYAAVFVGAGLSQPSGLLDWKDLLREFAAELGLDIDIEMDLPTVAQYHINAENDDRSRLHAKLVAALASPSGPSPAHEALAALPIHSYWTSNYDDLLEQSLELAGRQLVVFPKGLSLSDVTSDTDAVVLKLHGDLTDPESVVITRDDYARYLVNHPGFRDRLKTDLTNQTFLFVGFSFSDPHMALILEQLRQERGVDHQRKHFAIMRRHRLTTRMSKTARHDATHQQLRIRDLARYGISTVLVDNYDEIPGLLRELRARYTRRYVFISGAATDFGPRGEEWIENLGFRLGQTLIDRHLNLVSGLGLGVGRSVVSGALDALYRQSEQRIHDRLSLWPFPIVRDDTQDRRYRELMIRRAGFAVFFAGNRRGATGVELSPGIIQEYEICRLADVYPLPIGASGWAAADLWKRVDQEFDAIFPRGTPRRAFGVLNSASASEEQVLKALFRLIDHLRPP